MFPFDLSDERFDENASPFPSGEHHSRERRDRERQRYNDVITLASRLTEIASTQREIHNKHGDTPFKLPKDDPLRRRYETLGESASAALNTLIGFLLDNFDGSFSNEDFQRYLGDPNSHYTTNACELATVPEGLVPLAVIHELTRKKGLFVKLTNVPHFLEFARKHANHLGMF